MAGKAPSKRHRANGDAPIDGELEVDRYARRRRCPTETVGSSA